jgi:hypothetical protein
MFHCRVYSSYYAATAFGKRPVTRNHLSLDGFEGLAINPEQKTEGLTFQR